MTDHQILIGILQNDNRVWRHICRNMKQGFAAVLVQTFLAFTHLAVLSLILAIPKGGVLKALTRVFWEYPLQILTDPAGWFHETIRYFI